MVMNPDDSSPIALNMFIILVCCLNWAQKKVWISIIYARTKNWTIGSTFLGVVLCLVDTNKLESYDHQYTWSSTSPDIWIAIWTDMDSHSNLQANPTLTTAMGKYYLWHCLKYNFQRVLHSSVCLYMHLIRAKKNVNASTDICIPNNVIWIDILLSFYSGLFDALKYEFRESSRQTTKNFDWTLSFH